MKCTQLDLMVLKVFFQCKRFYGSAAEEAVVPTHFFEEAMSLLV